MRVNVFGRMLPLFFALACGCILSGCDFMTGEDSDENENSGQIENPGEIGASKNTLVEDVWKNGNITKDGQTDTYYIDVSDKTRYFIWLNNADDGDSTKTAYMGLKITHSDGTIISDSYGNVANCWSKPFTFLASGSGTVTITAASRSGWNWEQGVGTYAIRYTSRPEYDALSAGEWKEDRIIADGQTNKYTISADDETRYFIYLNNAYDGDDKKTAYTGLKITHSDGGNITTINDSYGNVANCWSKPFTFLSPGSGTVAITAACSSGWNWEQGIGTYAIRYTSRPEYDALSAGEWKNDSIIADGQTNKYYVYVTAGTQYSVYLNDAYDGDNSKTAEQIGVKIKYSQDSNSSNPVICDSYKDKLYQTPYTFTAPDDGTIIVTAASHSGWYWEQGTGTYAIKYTVSN